MTAKSSIGAQKLDHAWKHLCDHRIEEIRAAQDVLSEAERLVRNGFRSWPHDEWANQVQTIFTLWPGTRG